VKLGKSLRGDNSARYFEPTATDHPTIPACPKALNGGNLAKTFAAIMKPYLCGAGRRPEGGVSPFSRPLRRAVMGANKVGSLPLLDSLVCSVVTPVMFWARLVDSAYLYIPR
jgi:hypothetical protein